MTIIKVENIFNYNNACEILRKNFIEVAEIKATNNYKRVQFFDNNGNKVAEYRDKEQLLKLYNYNTHSTLVGKELRFA